MNILQVSPQVPCPPTDGGKVGIFNITKHLAERGHRITMAAFDSGWGGEQAPLGGYCRLLPYKHGTSNSPAGAFLNLFTDVPYNISKYHSPGFLDFLREVVGEGSFDVIHIDHLHMAEYGVALRERFGIPIVLREHNVESVIMERFEAHARNPLLRRYAGMQLGRLRAYEAMMAGRFDCCCPITPDDASRLKELNPRSVIRVVPGGVESSYFTPSESGPPVPDSLVFFGALDWIPNRDALEWFIDRIFPLILARRPGTRLHLIGKNAPRDIVAKAGPQCVVHGYVDDLRREVQRYAVSIAPYRIGGGMRLKIIESFAMGIPVVATPVGCEGIEAVDGEHLFVAADEVQFADRVVALLDDPGKRSAIGAAARSLAHARYRWETVAEMLENVYLEFQPAPGDVKR